MVKINKNQHITKNGKIKKNPTKIPYKKKITKDGEEYKLGLVTRVYVFYYLPNEEDDVLMFSRKMELISSNYFAYEEFLKQSVIAVKTKKYIYMDEDTKYNATQSYEESPEDWDNMMDDE